MKEMKNYIIGYQVDGVTKEWTEKSGMGMINTIKFFSQSTGVSIEDIVSTRIESVITITYVNAFHERLKCGGKKSHHYSIEDKELAALHYWQLFNSPHKYKNLESTFNFETIKIH